MTRRNRPKPLDIVSQNLVDRLWDEDDPVCDRKALVIVRGVLGQVSAEAAREATRKASCHTSAERAVIEAANRASWWRHSSDCDIYDEQIRKPCNCGLETMVTAVDALIAAREGR